MMNVIRPGSSFSNRGLRDFSCRDAAHCSAKRLIQTGGDTSAKQLKFRPIPPNDRTTKDWTAIAWPTNIQSKTPDGKFGPAKQMVGWGDCWFLAPLAAVANDQAGHKILAESIKKVRVEGIDGYHVTFAGSPDNPVFISDKILNNCLDKNGGDADTRLLELAAKRFFSVYGCFKSLYLAALLKKGLNPARAEICFQQWCQDNNDIQDPMMFNPMLEGGENYLALFMFTGMYPVHLQITSTASLRSGQIISYLNQYVTTDRDGTSIVIGPTTNPLGDGSTDSRRLVTGWDLIRTEITRDKRLRKQERAFLNALDRWLKTPNDATLPALRSAARKLRIPHIDPEEYVELLENDQIALRQKHRNILRSGVQEVLEGGPGFIGFTGGHSGTIEGINLATNTFTYSEPNYPIMVHTGNLSALIQEIISGNVSLHAAKTPTEPNEGQRFEHAGTSSSRHLRQIHNQVVRDGKIDQDESRPLADLMEMDAGAFRQIYDSDQNGLIEGDELKAVQLRVDRWVEHLELTPIW